MTNPASQAATVHFSPLEWGVFMLIVLGMLALDLFVFNRKAHVVKMKEALTWSVVWVAISLAFNVYIWRYHGTQLATEFLAGYLIEKSLSVDNIFVFVLIFTYFRVDPKYQHRILFWGIIGALVMRGIMIGAGAVLIAKFHWIIYIFGVFLIYTGIKMAFSGDNQMDPEESFVYRLSKKMLPLATKGKDYGQAFFVREGGRLKVTDLFLVLLIVEATDLVFAVDSIPAIFAVSRDPFIVFTSNIFAILGLRALYFLLADVMGMFRYLKYGLSAVLAFVGLKMLLSHTPFAIPIWLSLTVIVSILTLSVVASLIAERRNPTLAPLPPSDPPQ